MRFSGWALEGDERQARVELTFNGRTTVEAELGHERPDVPRNLRRPHATSACGWSAWADLAAWPPGDLHVTLTGFTVRGQPVQLESRSFRLTDSRLAGSVDMPRDGDEIRGDGLVVRGWASIDGRSAARIEVCVNGRPAGRARLRIPRPDVSGTSTCGFGSLTGFEYRGTPPDSRSAGLEISVAVVGFEGTRASLPLRTVHRVVRVCSAEETARASILRHRTAQLIEEIGHRPHRHVPHLLVFTHALDVGGGQLYLSELLHHLAPRLSRCTVISPIDGELRATLETWGIEVVVTGRNLSNDPEAYEGQVRELSLFILGTEPDVVLLNTLAAWPAGDAAQRVGLPTIWSIHESFELEHWLEAVLGHPAWHPYLKDRLVSTLAAANRLVFEADATRKLFAPFAEAERCIVLRYGVDIDEIDRYQHSFDRQAARHQYGIQDDALVMLSVGVIGERKATACLIEGFIEIADAYPEATLVVIGDYPSGYSKILHEIIDAAGLDDRLRLLPTASDIWHWYALSDVLVSASDIESLPRSMMEAMAFGLPTLSTDVFGIPEVITDGRNGWLFPACDMIELVAALHRVLSLSPEERRVVGRAGHEMARSEFRSESYADGYRQMIDDLAAEYNDYSGHRASCSPAHSARTSRAVQP
jgi:glycosyltransferase involved in cell wall biosynthesis